MKFERYKKEYRKQITALLLVCSIALGTLAAGLLTPTAVAADLTIDLSSDQEYASAQLLATMNPKGPFYIDDEYETVWGTDTQVDIFKSTYANGSGEVTVAGENSEKVIAPGTENSYTFALKNSDRGEYVHYMVRVEAFFTGLEGTGKVIPVEARLEGDQGWMLGNENEYRPVLELDGVEESSVLVSGQHAKYTLQWRWPFEQDLNGDGNIDDGDALDTWLASQDHDISLTIRISTLYTIESSGSSGSGTLIGRIPEILEDKHHFAYLYGYEDGTIRPEAEITRAQIAAIFFRLLKADIRQTNLTDECHYSDVYEDTWYRTEVATVTKLGLMEGYEDGTFRGEQPITRAELAAVLARISGRDISSKGVTKFKDIRKHWAEAEIETIEDVNWILGYGDGTFRPDDLCSRAEAAAMINRMLHRDPQKISDLLVDHMKKWPDNADPEMWYYLDIQEASTSHDSERLLGTREKWYCLIEDPFDVEAKLEKQ